MFHHIQTRLCIGGLVVLTGLSWGLPTQANDELPIMCNADGTAPKPANPGQVYDTDDCFETGAAVGEMGLNWRKKLPENVNWLVRKDAAELCHQTATEFGQRVDSSVPGGCVFLASDRCTIVAAGTISPASIGNAVRNCVP